MPRLKLLLLICFILLIGHPDSVLLGQKSKDKKGNDKGPAFTQPPKKDPTFSLMGEFVGRIKPSGKKAELLGLQVRAIGNDEVDAIAYRGGLPGQKKHQPDPIRMIGKRSGQFVVLSGGPWAVFVEKNSCRLIDLDGNKVGQLKRIKRRSPTLYSQPPAGATVFV